MDEWTNKASGKIPAYKEVIVKCKKRFHLGANEVM